MALWRWRISLYFYVITAISMKVLVPFVSALLGLGLMPLREVFTGMKLNPKSLVKSSSTTTKSHYIVQESYKLLLMINW